MATEKTYVHEVPLTDTEFELKKEIDRERAQEIESIFKIVLESD